jgi:hypothetical protein
MRIVSSHKSRAKFVTILFLLVIVGGGMPHALADAYNPLASTVGRGNILNYIVENGSVERNAYLAIMPPAVTSADETRSGKWKWCTGLDDPVCDPKNNPQNMKATSIFGPCASATDENCIDSIEIGTGANLEKASLIRVTAGLTFPAAPEYKYPGSSNISLWQTASGGHPFAVMPRMQLYFRDGAFSVGDFFTDVIPYEEVKGNYSQISINTSPQATPENRYNFPYSAQTCVFVENGVCGIAQDFAPDTRVKIKLRISTVVGGWFQGRLKDPVLDVSKFSNTSNTITLEAGSVTVPRMAVVVNPSTFTDAEKVWFQNGGQWPTVDGGMGSGAQAGDPEFAFPFIDFYRNRVKDTTVGTNTFWNFSTTSWGDGSACLQDKSRVLGIVTTNALAYDGGAPSFSDGFLNYRVSGLHYMPDGTSLVQGSYNLVMRSDTARCLYGFSNAPISATVSIVGGDNSSVATTVTGEKDGWLSMAASGFTFSTKTIQVQISQPKVAPAASPSPTPSATLAPMKTKTITCKRGKIVKKLSGTSPKCPAGYSVVGKG